MKRPRSHHISIFKVETMMSVRPAAIPVLPLVLPPRPGILMTERRVGEVAKIREIVGSRNHLSFSCIPQAPCSIYRTSGHPQQHQFASTRMSAPLENSYHSDPRDHSLSQGTPECGSCPSFDYRLPALMASSDLTTSSSRLFSSSPRTTCGTV